MGHSRKHSVETHRDFVSAPRQKPVAQPDVLDVETNLNVGLPVALTYALMPRCHATLWYDSGLDLHLNVGTVRWCRPI